MSEHPYLSAVRGWAKRLKDHEMIVCDYFPRDAAGEIDPTNPDWALLDERRRVYPGHLNQDEDDSAHIAIGDFLEAEAEAEAGRLAKIGCGVFVTPARAARKPAAAYGPYEEALF